MRKVFTRGLALAMMGLLGGAAYAQSIDADFPNPESEKGAFFVSTNYGHRFDANMDDGPGEFSTDDARLEIGGTADFGSVRWSTSFGYGFTHYNVNDLAVGATDLDVHSLTLASIVGIDIVDHCSILFGPMIGVAAEGDADWSDAISVGAMIGTVYRPSPDLSVGLSLVTVRRIEEGFGIAPIPMVDWRFGDGWQLYTGLTEAAARRGLGAFIARSFGKHWETAFGAQFEHRRFRIDAGDGIAEDKSVPVYLRVSWEMVRGLNLDVMGGASFAGRFKVNDSDDRFLGGRDYVAAPLIGVRLRYKFAG